MLRRYAISRLRQSWFYVGQQRACPDDLLSGPEVRGHGALVVGLRTGRAPRRVRVVRHLWDTISLLCIVVLFSSPIFCPLCCR